MVIFNHDLKKIDGIELILILRNSLNDNIQMLINFLKLHKIFDFVGLFDLFYKF